MDLSRFKIKGRRKRARASAIQDLVELNDRHIVSFAVSLSNEFRSFLRMFFCWFVAPSNQVQHSFHFEISVKESFFFFFLRLVIGGNLSTWLVDLLKFVSRCETPRILEEENENAIGDKVNAYWNELSNRRSLRKMKKKKTNNRERKEDRFGGNGEKRKKRSIVCEERRALGTYVRMRMGGMEIASFFSLPVSFVFFLLRSRYGSNLVLIRDRYIYIYFRNAVGHNARHYWTPVSRERSRLINNI